jgi:hypothetical protein
LSEATDGIIVTIVVEQVSALISPARIRAIADGGGVKTVKAVGEAVLVKWVEMSVSSSE